MSSKDWEVLKNLMFSGMHGANQAGDADGLGQMTHKKCSKFCVGQLLPKVIVDYYFFFYQPEIITNLLTVPWMTKCHYFEDLPFLVGIFNLYELCSTVLVPLCLPSVECGRAPCYADDVYRSSAPSVAALLCLHAHADSPLHLADSD